MILSPGGTLKQRKLGPVHIQQNLKERRGNKKTIDLGIYGETATSKLTPRGIFTNIRTRITN
jgi:hypothetical protein